MSDVKTKICKVCGKEKPIGEFYNRKSICKICEYLSKHQDLDNINDFSIEDNLIVLDYILNSKGDCLNNLEDILHKPLKYILINIQKLNIRNIKLSVKAKCEVCGMESIYKISEFLNRKNCFCSMKCHDIFQSYSYGCKEGYQKCGDCKEEKPYNEFSKNGENKYHTICNVCDFFKKRSLNIQNNWTLNEYKVIIDNLLNKKVNCINDIIPFLNNKTLEDIINILQTDLKTKGVEIKVKTKCEQCSVDIYYNIYQYLKNEHHFCSKECYDKWQLKEVLMSCKWCGKEFYKTPRQGQENYFCSHECSTKYHAKERTKDLVIVNCQYCGKEFERKEYNTGKIYCSEECSKNGFREKMSGENNSLYKERIKVECDWCGEIFGELESSYNLSEKHFCGNDCRNTYHAKVTQQSDEYKLKARENSVRNLENGLIPQTKTKPQLIINQLLNNLKIKYDNEYNCKYYAIDNYLIDYNLMIEVSGTFWHCDNREYKEINYLIQANNIKNDKSKNTYIHKYYNVDILYLWEYDIENNLELCKQLILEYINNKGNLFNYHSFNYNINNDNKLCINNDIIIPYMEYDIKELNKIIDLSVREQRSKYDPSKHITYNCDWCGEESTSLLIKYNESEHHFCSMKCNSLYYGNKRLKSNNICKECGNNIPHLNGLCKVCIFKLKVNLNYDDKWTEQFTNIILNNIIYSKIKYLNELEDILHMPLKDILEYVVNILKLRTKIKVKRNCQVCGVEFYLPANRIVNGKDKCCSKECGAIYQRKRMKTNCDFCGKDLDLTESKYNNHEHHFCNLNCLGKWNGEQKKNRIIKECIICGEEFEIIPSRENAITCSKECQAKWQSKYLIGENANNYKNGLFIKI